MKNNFLFYFLLVSCTSYIGCSLSDDAPPEIRRGRQCGTPVEAVPDNQSQNRTTGGLGLGNQLSSEEKEALSNFPKKIKIERPRLIAKLKYQKDWTEDPNAVRKLILFFEKTLQLPAFKATGKESGSPLNLSHEQKLSIFDQLRDFEINLEERPGEPQDQPIEGGDVPSPLGGEEPIATFETIDEHNQQNADAFVTLFMSGHDDFTLDSNHLKTLRSYLLRGGFLIADSCCGESGFEQGFKKMLEQMFPGNKLVPLPEAHPIYKGAYDLNRLRYTGKEAPENSKPRLLGMQLGCRTAIVYSPDDLSCGWDGHMHGKGASREINNEDALKLGTNMIAYALGYRRLGSPLASEIPEDTKPFDPREIVFAQLSFQGDFDPDPYGTANLIQRLKSTLNIPLKPTRLLLNPTSDDLTLYPFVYLTGHGSIGLSDLADKKLETYLKQGGFLLSDACCGDEIFDHSFRDLMKKVSKDFTFKILKPGDPLFQSYTPTRSVPLTHKGQTTLLKKWAFWKGVQNDSIDSAFFLGWFFENRLCVLYSPLDIGCSLKGQPCLLCEGIDSKGDAGFKLMANLLVSLLT